MPEEIIKIRTGINNIVARDIRYTPAQPRSWFLENISDIDQSQTRLTDQEQKIQHKIKLSEETSRNCLYLYILYIVKRQGSNFIKRKINLPMLLNLELQMTLKIHHRPKCKTKNYKSAIRNFFVTSE